MRQTILPIPLCIVVMFLSVTAAGCVPLVVGAAAGAGSVAYAKGVLEKGFDKSVEALHRASVKGIKDLKLFIVSDEARRHTSKVVFEFDDGQKGEVTIKAMTEQSAKMKIRVGIFGDEVKSQMVLNAIQKHL